jgi:hypothetical protein
MSGELRFEVPIQDACTPFIKVLTPKIKSGWDEGDGSATGENKKGKKKAKAESHTPELSTSVDDGGSPIMDVDAEGKQEDDGEPTTVLAVHKIDTMEDTSGRRHILFSVTGYIPLVNRSRGS